ncbi:MULTISPECIES: hypothetical protein [Reichenbachiella]|nr:MULTISPECIES: hypothetical protein [Reichenbachiella]RJE72725.1 hypothetical protein BGP76_01810 [Reichenbachiella sp. MSK19-1]
MSNKPRSKAVISLSVLPTRFKGLTPTLNSLTDQSVLPEKIILNLPKAFERDKAEYIIPDYVTNHPLVEINWIEKDMGPATKLLPTLNLYENEPEKLIIIVDDDQLYPKGMVENYINQSKSLPDAAMTLSGWTVPSSFDHGDKVQLYGAIVRIYRKDTSVDEPVRVDCLQGAASFAVKPKLFDRGVFDFDNAPREAFFVDDIWVSGNLSRCKSPVYVVPAPFRYGRFVSLRQSAEFGLSSTVNADNTNNNKLYRYFQKEWWSLNQ